MGYMWAAVWSSWSVHPSSERGGEGGAERVDDLVNDSGDGGR